jgi:hypothetical protein
MLTPQNQKVVGPGAIASAGRGAFIGFACQDFMRYDYHLGRKNCYDFLRKTFVLSDNNPVFGQRWTAYQKANFAKDAPGSAAQEQQLDDWPKGKLDPEVYRGAIRARFRAISEVATSGEMLRSFLDWLGAQSFQFSAADFVINLMNESLRKANLD